MGGRLFMPGVHHGDAFLHQACVDGGDVQPGQGEDVADALPLQHSGYQLSAGDHGHSCRLS